MTLSRLWKSLSIFAAAGALAAWGALAFAADTPSGPGAQTHRPEAVIGPDDSVSILALNCDEISKTWRISSAGELNLPMVGAVRAAGLTVQQLEDTLADRLKKFVIEPQVTVFVTDFRSQPVTVTGAVEKPGVYQLETGKTLFEVLVMAGGPKNAGSTVNLKRVTRRGEIGMPGVVLDKDGVYESVDLDLKEVLEGRGNKASLSLKPDDLITVSPAHPARFVHIAGEVNKPGAVELVTQDVVSLMKVLAVAGGLTKDAKGSATMIMHNNTNGVLTSTAFVNLDKIERGKARDLELTDGDVVVVPTSGVKSTLHQAQGAAMSSGIYAAINILARY
jgi:polysaccharide export outer membrane protein